MKTLMRTIHISSRLSVLNEAAVLNQYDLLSKTNGVEIKLAKDEVPAVIELLVMRQIRIYEVKVITKSLEDRFLEMTGETKEEVQHA